MFKRNLMQDLVNWSKKPKRKPLILRGARQVGKTTLIDEFARQFDQYIYLNLEIKADRDLFIPNYTIDELVSVIYFHKNMTTHSGLRTLIFIDEIQYSPHAVTMLRYFFEKRSDLFVIAAGSLLESLIDSHISFPVGRVEYKFLYPFSFNEYLLAANEGQAFELLQQQPCPDFAHEKLLKLFHQYVLIGGLPEAVSVFLENKNIISVNEVYRNLMIAYMDDVEKYAPNKTLATIIRHAIQHAPLQAGSRIKFQGFGQSDYKSREMGEALRLLEKALLIKLVYPTVAVIPPAEADHKKSPKLQFLDTGLINFSAGLQQYYFSLTDLNSIYSGKIVEHMVGQELLANNSMTNNELKFWVREKIPSSAEVDYVVSYDRYLIPIEVKSGKSGTLRSLQQYMEMTNHSYAVRFYAGRIQTNILETPSKKKFTLLNLPYYLVGNLRQYLDMLFKQANF